MSDRRQCILCISFSSSFVCSSSRSAGGSSSNRPRRLSHARPPAASRSASQPWAASSARPLAMDAGLACSCRSKDAHPAARAVTDHDDAMRCARCASIHCSLSCSAPAVRSFSDRPPPLRLRTSSIRCDGEITLHINEQAVDACSCDRGAGIDELELEARRRLRMRHRSAAAAQCLQWQSVEVEKREWKLYWCTARRTKHKQKRLLEREID